MKHDRYSSRDLIYLKFTKGHIHQNSSCCIAIELCTPPKIAIHPDSLNMQNLRVHVYILHGVIYGLFTAFKYRTRHYRSGN